MREKSSSVVNFILFFKFITARIYSNAGPLKNKSLKDFSFNDTQPAKLIIKKFCSLHVMFQSLLDAVVKNQAKHTSQLPTAPPTMLVTWVSHFILMIKFYGFRLLQSVQIIQVLQRQTSMQHSTFFQGAWDGKTSRNKLQQKTDHIISALQAGKQNNKLKKAFCLHYLLNISICACKK